MNASDDKANGNETVASAWQQALKTGGYNHAAGTKRDLRRITKLSRTWRTILKATALSPGASTLEIGCGGGKQLVPLVVRGYDCSGLDCSPEVLIRCRELMHQVAKVAGRPVDVGLTCADFLEYETDERFDLVYNFGVVEHFLDAGQRAAFIRKCVEICQPNGWVVSVVPSGIHPMRERMRLEGLGGYQIPEIDYDPHLMSRELTEAGGQGVKVIPNNLYAHILIDPSVSASRQVVNRALYLSAQMIPRYGADILFRRAGSLIGIAQVQGEHE